MRSPRVWKLRQHLWTMLLVTMALTFLLASAIVVFWRVPQIERAGLHALDQDVADVAERLELLLGARQARLELMARLLRGRTPQQAAALLDTKVQGGEMFRAVYLVSPRGQVEAVGLTADLPLRGEDILGSDLSANPLYQAVRADRPSAWSGRMLSVLSATLVVGVAQRDATGRVLIGEVPVAALLQDLQAVAGANDATVWVVDRGGEVVADTRGRYTGLLNLYNWPLLQAALQGRTPPSAFWFEGQRRLGALAHAPTLDWYVIGSMPRGWQHPDVRQVVQYALGGFAGCLAIGLLVAPFWARRMARPLQQIVERAALTTAEQAQGQRWPRGPVSEFNGLSRDLETMADTLQERERKLQALFSVAPVPMAVVDMDNGYRYLDVNQAWSEEMGHARADTVGRSALELGLWPSQDRYEEMLCGARGDTVGGEIEVVCKSGERKLFQSFGRTLSFQGQRLVVWGSINIGPLRRVEQELRALNQDLEARVAQRAEALKHTYAELSDTLARLRATQAELAHAGKMAALGGLVAGVAHELNTPLGNAVLAVSAMDDASRRFSAAARAGLRRADLREWTEHVVQGADIAGRNLRRAADLVQSFKQVAVDQTSAQRRQFALGEVVHEMVTSLRPSFARTPYRIEVQVPERGLELDSYPGALGQVLGNLVQNAVRHGFEGRAHGTVRITAGRAGEAEAGADGAGRIWLRVADDGRGIAPEHLDRIFDPFMTLQMGQGGRGLGLHSSYNAVVQLLGGTLTVQSTPGQGSCFEVRLPDVAPQAAAQPLEAGAPRAEGAR